MKLIENPQMFKTYSMNVLICFVGLSTLIRLENENVKFQF